MNLEEHRAYAINLKIKYLESVFEPLVEEAFQKLVEWIPNRRISLVWGVGTFCLNIEKKCSYSYTPFWDNYGSVNNFETIYNNLTFKKEDNPILYLAGILEECYDDETGCYLPLKDRLYNPITRGH